MEGGFVAASSSWEEGLAWPWGEREGSHLGSLPHIAVTAAVGEPWTAA